MNLSCPIIGQPTLTASQVREYLRRSLATNPPLREPLPDADRHTVRLALPATLGAALRMSAEQRKTSVATEAGERVHGLRIRERLNATLPAESLPRASDSKTDDDDLQRLRVKAAHYAEAAIAQKQIALIEAATGSGKSRMIANAAAHILANDPDACIWIVAPSLTILSHLIAESNHVAGLTNTRGTVILGRRQFVSPTLAAEGIHTILKSEDSTELVAQCEALDAWLRDGAPPRSAGTKQFALYVPSLSHTADDATLLAPDLPISDWTLDNAPADLDANLRGKIEATRNHDASLIYTTHAYLAAALNLASLRQVPLTITHLIVDEAHALEENIAQSRCHGYSTLGWQIWAKAQKGGTSDSLRKATDAARKAIASQVNSLDEGRIPDAIAEKIRHSLMPVLRACKSHAEDSGEVKELEGLLRPGHSLYLTLSRVRRYPTLIAGPASVRNYLREHLWGKVRNALLYSATLFLIDRSGQPNAHYTRIKLGIPPERILNTLPLNYRDIYAAPMLHIPTPAQAGSLCYPGASQQDSMEVAEVAAGKELDQWHNNVSEHIRAVAESAIGGTLVLTTSFADARSIAHRLPDLRERLIDAESRLRSSLSADRFRAAAQAGLKPLWFATGNAWTGLDLRDHDAEHACDDTLLTDLVIVRVPQSLNRSSTQIARLEWMGFRADVAECGIRLKQGIGRLIRRPGVKNRRLHILDGRLIATPRPHYIFYRNILAPYINRNPLLPPQPFCETRG